MTQLIGREPIVKVVDDMHELRHTYKMITNTFNGVSRLKMVIVVVFDCRSLMCYVLVRTNTHTNETRTVRSVALCIQSAETEERDIKKQKYKTYTVFA